MNDTVIQAMHDATEQMLKERFPQPPTKICRLCSVEMKIRRGKMLLTGKCPICSEYHILFKVREAS